MSKTFSYYIPHIMCVGCSVPILNTLSQNILFNTVDIDPLTKKLIIQTSDVVTEETMINILGGYFKPRNERCLTWDRREEIGFLPNPGKWRSLFTPRKLGLLGVVVGSTIMIVMLLFAPFSFFIMLGIGIFSTLLTAILGFKFFKKAIQDGVRDRRLTMDTLFSLGTLTVLAVSWCALFLPGFCFMFEAGLLIFGFRYIGLEVKDALNKPMGLRELFSDRLSKYINVLRNGSWSLEAINKISVGDLVQLEPDSWVSLEGVIESEYAWVNEQFIKGRSWIVKMCKGEVLKRGAQIKNEKIIMRVTAPWQDDHPFIKIDQKIEYASVLKFGYIEKSSRWMQYFIPTVLLIALISGIIVGSLFSLGIGLIIASSIVVSACPCTLALIVPLAIRIGMDKASSDSLIIKNASVLESASDVDRLVFDLNGTLTKGIPQILSHKAYDSMEMDMLDCLASLESESAHGVANAIRKYVNLKGARVKPQEFILEKEILQPHNGVSGFWHGKRILIGDSNCMRQAKVKITNQPELQGEERVIYIACDGVTTGHLIWTDPLREDAVTTINKLRKKTIYLATGENEEVAKRYAAILRINPENVYAGLNGGEEKADIIQSLRKGGHVVAMVGDGGNDAAAISASNVGIVMPSDGMDPGTQQQSDVELRSGRLSSLITLFAVAKETVSHIKQNLGISLFYNSISMFVASALFLSLGFMLNPGIGVLLMIVQMGIVFANTYRIKHRTLQGVTKDHKSTGTYNEISNHMTREHCPQLQGKNSLTEDQTLKYNDPIARSTLPLTETYSTELTL